MKATDQTLKALATALNLRRLRQDIISSNIANADTPHYKAKRIDFEAALARALDIDGHLGMKSSHEKHFDVGSGGFDSLKPEIYEDPNGVVNEDGNTVDREQEMVRMTENKILYDAAIRLLNKKLGLMKYALKDDP